MYIKDGLIYVYQVKEDKVLELNNYASRLFTKDEIRDKLGYTAVPFIDQFYKKEKPVRRTGSAPESRKIVVLRPVAK
ncbi:MAG: hypothetical protein LBB62_00210 [Proteiniphilum sp.]|jgi:hypothetical protein|nr:hypothetical protein [Proteiniphilum sp.]